MRQATGQFLFIRTSFSRATGAVLVALIIIYVATQLASSYVSSINIQDKNQKRLLFLFPFLFVPVVINFEAGLLVYWITTNTWTIGQQLFIRRFLPPPEPHVAGASPGAGAERDPRSPPGPALLAGGGGKAASAPRRDGGNGGKPATKKGGAKAKAGSGARRPPGGGAKASGGGGNGGSDGGRGRLRRHRRARRRSAPVVAAEPVLGGASGAGPCERPPGARL